MILKIFLILSCVCHASYLSKVCCCLCGSEAKTELVDTSGETTEESVKQVQVDGDDAIAHKSMTRNKEIDKAGLMPNTFDNVLLEIKECGLKSNLSIKVRNNETIPHWLEDRKTICYSLKGLSVIDVLREPVRQLCLHLAGRWEDKSKTHKINDVDLAPDGDYCLILYSLTDQFECVLARKENGTWSWLKLNLKDTRGYTIVESSDFIIAQSSEESAQSCAAFWRKQRPLPLLKINPKPVPPEVLKRDNLKDDLSKYIELVLNSVS